MCSSAPPPAPDYEAAAKETAAGNLEAARAQTAANRVNQITPYGSLTYSQTPPPPVFDQSGYDAAMAQYQKDLQNYQQAAQTGGTTGRTFWGSPVGGGEASSVPGSAMTAPVAPTKAAFTTQNLDAGWQAEQKLSPDQQRILEANTSLQQGLLGTAEQGLGKVNELLANPTIDESKLAQMPISGQSVQDAIMSRLQPNIDRQREQLRTQLANQGITMGSEAYQGAFQDQSQRENDLMTQAALQGIGTGLTARQQGIQEQTYMQDRPLNVVNALRTGNQVTGPQFVAPPQQVYTPGADIMGATQQNYGAQLGNVNAQNAQNSQTASTLGTVAGIAAMMF